MFCSDGSRRTIHRSVHYVTLVCEEMVILGRYFSEIVDTNISILFPCFSFLSCLFYNLRFLASFLDINPTLWRELRHITLIEQGHCHKHH